jgi:hypothetical protein
MADEQYRGLLTEREREILSGQADVTDGYYRRVKSRVRDKIERTGNDHALLSNHEPELAKQLRTQVCE